MTTFTVEPKQQPGIARPGATGLAFPISVLRFRDEKALRFRDEKARRLEARKQRKRGKGEKEERAKNRIWQESELGNELMKGVDGAVTGTVMILQAPRSPAHLRTIQRDKATRYRSSRRHQKKGIRLGIGGFDVREVVKKPK